MNYWKHSELLIYIYFPLISHIFRAPFPMGFPIVSLGPWEELFSNVLLAGGSSLLRGLPERLQKDLAAMLPESSRSRVEVVAPDTRLGGWGCHGVKSWSLKVYRLLMSIKELVIF